jgi:hypothetical protein
MFFNHDSFANVLTGVLEKYGALCIGVVGEAPQAGEAASAGSPAAAADDDEMQFGEMIPFGDPSW